MFATTLIAASSAVRAQSEPIVTSDLLRIRSVASIDVSEDGSRAVVAVRSIGERAEPIDDENKRDAPRRGHAPHDVPANGRKYAYQQHLFLVNLNANGDRIRQLTFGDRMDRSPAISPDGRHIVFVRDGDEETGIGGQVWMMPLDGGEAWQVTTLEHGAIGPVFSPDGSMLLVSSSIPMKDLPGEPLWPSERPGAPRTGPHTSANPRVVEARPDGTREEIRAWLEAKAKEHDPNVITRIDFQEEHSLKTEPRFAHFFVIDLTDPAYPARRITEGFYDHTQPAFMPDSRRIMYVAKKPTDVHPDRVRRTDLWTIGVDGSDDRMILAIQDYTVSSPRPSADGAVVAFIGQQLDQPADRQRRIGIMPAEGGTAAWVTAGEDPSVFGLRWMSARNMIVYNMARRGGFPLMGVGGALTAPEPLVDVVDGLPVGVGEFDVGGPAIVYSMTTADNPCVLMARVGNQDGLVLDLNEWVYEKILSRPVRGEATAADGTKVEYWVMEPTNRVPGRKYPTVLEIHGGPSAMWGPGEFTMWHEFQLLCSWGYGVVYANPRGSGGYGYDFQRANFQNWGEGPGGDVLAALDRAMREPWIDPDQLFVTGGSYGGYLTAWIVTQDHRFKAAVAQRGVYDLPTFFGEGNAWRLVKWAMGGQPYESRHINTLRANSPFSFVSAIRTPLLIMHADDDLRTGVSQSEMLYRALKAMNKPVEYVRYPNAGHDLSRTGDPSQRMDRLNRIIEFFDRYTTNRRPAPLVQPSSTPSH